ncbi:putative Zn-dependent peptidase [Pontibacter ummariensis]|uniref:Predicted Zn-dependent peptidase n=1 Tax=Pontibacter ummariensis TaxID=1610492 RepID=A0A239BA64_9BACT|nr:pitrilysin family protein [Pontibacter ummariensis]PRY16422.1 putative Zn-dependent peptidase [Pontibacter ummariensis]SNS04885.1 Predicted Zn-dependent peptidase [Pontibacter ummariensis]
MPDYHIHTLPNGIRIVHKQVLHTKIAHSGFIMDIGSRDELPQEQGLAHFWEHMAFKGTEKRKSFHILNRLESVGGELNAYTTKEKVCFYSSVLDKHFDKSFELLTDITFRSVFPEREIEKERGVILEEMSMYLDTPEEAIVDEFDAVVFDGHPLGNNILGTKESVSSFTKQNFLSFIDRNLGTDSLLFCSVSNLPFEMVLKLAEKYLSDVPPIQSNRSRITFSNYAPKTVTIEKPISQAHCVLGCPAYALSDERRIPFFMLVNLLGGPGMNSRLNLAVREKHGLVYTIDANYATYIDTGLLSIYFGTEKKQLKRTTSLVLKELKKLREKPLGTMQLHTAKEQLMGQLAMAEESNMGLMMMIGKSILDQEKVESLNEIFDQIRSITASDLMDIANDALREDNLSFLNYVPA